MAANSQEYFVEFAVDDAEQALDFYEHVFDWATLSVGGSFDYHIMGPVGEEAVLGIFPSALAPHTLIYFQTNKFDDVVERVQKHGGRIIVNQKVQGVGFVAQWIDPQGNRFALTCDRLPLEMAGDPSFITIDPKRVSRRLPNENVRGKSVRAVYAEIVVSDGPAALDFYQKVFDWGSLGVAGTAVPFHLAGRVGSRAQAAIMPSAMGPQSLAYFETDNIGERANRIRRGGGRVVRVSKLNGVGEIGHFKDPFGNPFGLVDYAKTAEKMRREGSQGEEDPANKKKHQSPNIFPFMRFRDADAGMEWLSRAFGFEQKVAYRNDDNAIRHAQMSLGPGIVMLGQGDPKDPLSQGIYIAVDDVDAHYERAKAAGAEIVRALEDTDYDSREYTARDPEGHLWSFGKYHPKVTDLKDD